MAKEMQQPEQTPVGDRGEQVVREDAHVKITKYADGTVRKDMKLVRPRRDEE